MKKLSLNKISLTALDAAQTQKVVGGGYTRDEFTNCCVVSSPMESVCASPTQDCITVTTCPPSNGCPTIRDTNCESVLICVPIE